MNFPGVIAFINPKSGGKHGNKVYLKLCVILGEDRVFDLTRGGPEQGLRRHRNMENLKIIACGGDGTVGWIHSWVDKIKFASPPAVVPFPLGTGNDMSRVLGWGANYAGEAIVSILEDIHRAATIKLDRWTICSEPLEDQDLLLLKSLVFQCDKSFSKELRKSSSEVDNGTPRNASAPPKPLSQSLNLERGGELEIQSDDSYEELEHHHHHKAPRKFGRSSASSSASSIPASSRSIAPPSTPPPTWMSSRRLRFNTASDIPDRSEKKTKLKRTRKAQPDASASSSATTDASLSATSSTLQMSESAHEQEADYLATSATLSISSSSSSIPDQPIIVIPKAAPPTKLKKNTILYSSMPDLPRQRGIKPTSGSASSSSSHETEAPLNAHSNDTSTSSTLEMSFGCSHDENEVLKEPPPRAPVSAGRRRKKKSPIPLSSSTPDLEQLNIESSTPRKKKKQRDIRILAQSTEGPAPNGKLKSRSATPLSASQPNLRAIGDESEAGENSEAASKPTWMETMKRLPDLHKVPSTSALSTSSTLRAERRTLVMNNYFSLGVDSMVALDFHIKREASPSLFPHHLINKAWYGVLGVKHAMLNLSKDPELRRVMRLELDGEEVAIPKGAGAIVCLQIPSYSSGTDAWGSTKKHKCQKAPPTVGDGMFEVVALRGVMHLSALQAGLGAGIRLGQASSATLYNLCVLPVQCDGEPWILPPCKTTIEFRNQSSMLFNTNLGKSTPKRFKSVTGHTLPSQSADILSDNSHERSVTSQELSDESYSSELYTAPARLRASSSNSFSSLSSTQDVPSRVRTASKIITRSYGSLPALEPSINAEYEAPSEAIPPAPSSEPKTKRKKA